MPVLSINGIELTPPARTALQAVSTRRSYFFVAGAAFGVSISESESMTKPSSMALSARIDS
jgi:hypothetical protein